LKERFCDGQSGNNSKAYLYPGFFHPVKPNGQAFFSDDFFRTNIEVPKPKMTEVDLSSWLQPQQQQGSRLRLQRKAKTKEKRYAQLISDDDDDDFEEVTPSKKRKKTENKNYNINNKAIVQHEDGCMSIDIITDDDEDENLKTNAKSKDDQNSIGSTLTEKIKNVVKRPIQTITDIWNKKSDTNNNGQSHNDGEGSQNSIQSNDSPTKSKKETEEKVECPMCAKKFPTKDVMDHAFYCDGVKETRSTRSSSNGNASTGDYQNWVGACHSLNEKPGSSSGASNSKIPVELPEFSGKKKKKPSENSFRGPKQQFAEPAPQHPSTTNTSNVFTKLKDDGPKERNPTLDEGFGDSQEDIIAGYTTVRPRKPNRTYGRGVRRKNYFDHENSQGDGGTIKCARCNLSVPEERYKEHTDNCLNESTLS